MINAIGVWLDRLSNRLNFLKQREEQVLARAKELEEWHKRGMQCIDNIRRLAAGDVELADSRTDAYRRMCLIRGNALMYRCGGDYDLYRQLQQEARARVIRNPIGCVYCIEKMEDPCKVCLRGIPESEPVSQETADELISQMDKLIAEVNKKLEE